MRVSNSSAKELRTSEHTPYLLFGLLTLLAFAIGGTAWKFHLDQKTAFENEIKNRLTSIANNKARRARDWRDAWENEARALMEDPVAIAALRSAVRSGGADSRVEAMLDSMCRNLHYAGAVLLDPEGRVRLRSGQRFGDDGHLAELTKQVVGAGQIVETDFQRSATGKIHLGINLPLRAAPGAPIFGVLLLSADPRDFVQQLQKWPVPTRSGEVLLVRRDGDSVLFLTDLRGRPGTALTFSVPMSRRNVAAVLSVNGAQGTVEALDYRGVPVFAALYPVPDTPWYLIAKMDSDEVWEPFRHGSTLLGVTAFSLVIASGALLFVLWRRHQLRIDRELGEASDARRAMAEQYDYLSRFANDVILLLDPDGCIVRANDRATDVYGYPIEDLPGMNLHSLCAQGTQSGFPSEWRLSGGRDSILYESVHRTRDGREFAVEISMRSLDVDGRIYRQAIIRDISERKQAELELSQSETRFRQLVENAPYAMVVLDGLEILYANPAALAMFGASREGALIGRSMLQFVRPEDREAMLQNARLFRSGKEVPAVERRYRRLDGGEFWASVSCTAFEYNECPATLLFCQDVSERRRASALEEQLRQSQKMESVGRLAGGVAHDFNNYLTVINGYCDMLLGDVAPGGEFHDGLVEIRSAGERATLVTRQLLAFSRKQLAAPRPISMNQTVADAGKMLRHLIGDHIEIATRLEPGLGDVLMDPGQMDQVLMNLAINARDAMPSGGRIVISTGGAHLSEADTARFPLARPGAYAVLSVSDNGIGIPAEIHQKIFEPFFTTKSPGHGTGLGLSTAYGIVLQAKGWIELESAPGAGATFRIWLPAIVDAPAAPAPSVQRPDAAGRDATLLVVEDQASVRRLALSILKLQGYKLLEAEGPEQALAASAGHAGKIDLLLTDVVMPGMNGPELAATLAAKRPGLKVVYMSGYAADAVGHEGFLGVATEFLRKPFTPEELAARVRKVLTAPSGNGRTVLVVDDDPAVCGLMRRILGGAGYAVVLAANGRQGMDVVRSRRPDLVITDLVMPEQEGLETVTLLRREHPDLPVIAISGAFNGNFLKVAGMLGAAATLPKPVAPETLLEAVAKFLPVAAPV
jgi:PAS domain S-box-containing protein